MDRNVRPILYGVSDRNVLFLQSGDGMHSVRRRNAVERLAVAKDWILRSGIYSVDGRGMCVLHREAGAKTFADLAEMWQLHGVIVECDDNRGFRIPSSQFGTLPAVFLAPASPPRGKRRSAVVRDERSLGVLAARKLLESGYPDYAFVPAWGNPAWSAGRGAGFAAAIRKAGKKLHVCPADARPAGYDADNRPFDIFWEPLARWLRALPVPLGIFAANDRVALAILDVCHAIGRLVPDAAAVIGVDNRTDLCESAKPTLSSIAVDFESEGEAAMRLLDEMMSAPDKVFPPRKCAAAAVVRRESTRFAEIRFRDGRLARAMEFIRRNACSGIGPDDVAKAMCVSRPMADLIFRRGLGSSMLSQIHAVRLEKAKAMLAGGTHPDIVAQECGYHSLNDFRRVFRHRVGATVGHWLKENVI